MWDERYSADTYAYGTEPNVFLRSMLDRLPEGRVLCLGEGEGRNATWLALKGREVTAVDSSEVGLRKAQRLAQSRGVDITTVHADLKDFPIEHGGWDAIVSIFCHVPPPLRRDMHRRCAVGLKPGGMFLLEAYTPAQLAYGTGGPPNAELMMDLESLSAELEGLEFVYAKELIRDVHEGSYHDGPGAVVQLLAKRS